MRRLSSTLNRTTEVLFKFIFITHFHDLHPRHQLLKTHTHVYMMTNHLPHHQLLISSPISYLTINVSSHQFLISSSISYFIINFFISSTYHLIINFSFHQFFSSHHLFLILPLIFYVLSFLD